MQDGYTSHLIQHLESLLNLHYRQRLHEIDYPRIDVRLQLYFKLLLNVQIGKDVLLWFISLDGLLFLLFQLLLLTLPDIPLN